METKEIIQRSLSNSIEQLQNVNVIDHTMTISNDEIVELVTSEYSFTSKVRLKLSDLILKDGTHLEKPIIQYSGYFTTDRVDTFINYSTKYLEYLNANFININKYDQIKIESIQVNDEDFDFNQYSDEISNLIKERDLDIESEEFLSNYKPTKREDIKVDDIDKNKIIKNLSSIPSPLTAASKLEKASVQKQFNDTAKKFYDKEFENHIYVFDVGISKKSGHVVFKNHEIDEISKPEMFTLIIDKNSFGLFNGRVTSQATVDDFLRKIASYHYTLFINSDKFKDRLHDSLQDYAERLSDEISKLDKGLSVDHIEPANGPDNIDKDEFMTKFKLTFSYRYANSDAFAWFIRSSIIFDLKSNAIPFDFNHKIVDTKLEHSDINELESSIDISNELTEEIFANKNITVDDTRIKEENELRQKAETEMRKKLNEIIEIMKG